MIKNVSNWFFGSFFRALGRIVLYVLIGFLLSFILSKLDIKMPSLLFSNTYARTYQLENDGTTASFYPSGSNSNLKWTQLYYNGTANIILNGWTFNTSIIYVEDPQSSFIFDGRYLVSFYVYGVGTFTDLKCNQITSTFYNVNRTTGNLITSEITNNKCVDIYRTTYNGYNAYRILFEFTYTNKTGAGGITDFRFVFNSGHNPIKGGSTGINYGFQVEGINDYDISVIDNWNAQKNGQTIINQNNQIITGIGGVAGGIASVESSVDDVKDSIDNQTSVIGASIGVVGNQIAGLSSQVTDTSNPDNLNVLSGSAGWLPAGPIDSVLNLPLTFLNNVFDNLSNTCEPVSLPLPFVDRNLQLPCMNSIYSQIDGVPTWINGTVGVIASAFILFYYLLHLYKYVDETLTFRENNFIDNWSGV